jgi:hypothetical protein
LAVGEFQQLRVSAGDVQHAASQPPRRYVVHTWQFVLNERLQVREFPR